MEKTRTTRTVIRWGSFCLGVCRTELFGGWASAEGTDLDEGRARSKTRFRVTRARGSPQKGCCAITPFRWRQDWREEGIQSDSPRGGGSRRGMVQRTRG